jgi:hypothetical protein
MIRLEHSISVYNIKNHSVPCKFNRNSVKSRYADVTAYGFSFQWLYSRLLGPGLFFSFVIIFTQTVGLLGRVISPSQGSYLHTGQHRHRINAHTDIHALSGIRTHDPSVRASEDSSCFRKRGYCDRLIVYEYKRICERAFTRCKTNRKIGVISAESSKQVRKNGVVF